MSFRCFYELLVSEFKYIAQPNLAPTLQRAYTLDLFKLFDKPNPFGRSLLSCYPPALFQQHGIQAKFCKFTVGDKNCDYRKRY